MYPTDLKYTKEHEWLKIEDDVCTVGITDFAQKELGEVVFVDLPEVGASFEAEEELGSLESVKAVAEVYAPLTGEVTEVNEALEDAPELVNEEPHAGGWLCKMKIADGADLSSLMDAEAYEAFTAEGE